MHCDLGESNLSGQEINPFHDRERVRFCQSPYNSRIQTFERKAFGLAIDFRAVGISEDAFGISDKSPGPRIALTRGAGRDPEPEKILA